MDETRTRSPRRARSRPRESAAHAISPDRLQAHAYEIRRRLTEQMPVVTTELNFATPLDLLVATILSQQCRDVTVNAVTDALFQKYRTPEDYANTPWEALAGELVPVTYPGVKARHITRAARTLIDRHDGEVPRTTEEIVALPGVGRKTAAVVLGNAFGIQEGIAVDTHVRRVSQRLGLTAHDDPETIEVDLMALVPQEEWTSVSHRLIFHGRRVCVARGPRCAECILNDICPSPRV